MDASRFHFLEGALKEMTVKLGVLKVEIIIILMKSQCIEMVSVHKFWEADFWLLKMEVISNARQAVKS